MEFFIKKNATLPVLKLQVVKDGRSDYNKMMDLIEESSIFFSMIDTENGIPKLVTRPAGFVNKIMLDPNASPEYYVYYQFTNKDTNRVGRYEGQFLLKTNEGNLILPIREKLYITVQDSFISDDLMYDSCYVSEFPCCVPSNPVITTTTTQFCFINPETPTELTLVVTVLPGSVNITYNLFSNKPVIIDTTLNFTHNLGVFSGLPITITTGVTISQGSNFGSTLINLDEDYSNLTRLDQFTNVTTIPSNLNWQIEEIFPISPTPTNTPTNTPTVTPTVTPTNTPTVTPTNTITPTPTLEPLNLTLFVGYTPGSIIVSYTLSLNRSYGEDINVTFENILNVYSGSPITIFTGVTVNSGSLSGQTIVTVNEDYNNYTGVPYFSQLSGTPNGSTWEVFVIPSTLTPTPTPTPTNTPLPPTCISTWMTENFSGTVYRNGDPIPQATNSIEWIDATTNQTGAWCYYNFDSNNGPIYGKLYNWYVVGDPRGIGPNGYVVPSEDDYTSLENCLGGNSIAGGKMKTTGTTEDNTGLWNSPNAGATNESGFSGTPNGYMSDGGVSDLRNIRGSFWTTTDIGGGSVMVMNLNNGRTDVYHGPDSKGKGYTIRLKQL